MEPVSIGFPAALLSILLTFQVDEPLDRMDDNRDRQRHQKDSVEKGCQNLGPLPTIGQHISFRMFRDPNGVESNNKGQDVAVQRNSQSLV